MRLTLRFATALTALLAFTSPVAAQQTSQNAARSSESAAASTPPPSSVDERITAALMSVNHALPIAQLRAICRVRNATLHERLAALTQAGRLVRGAEGYQLAPI